VLREAGCTRIFEEKVSGAKRDRPELGRLLDHLRSGDVVTVTRLDRLARSTRDLLEIAERIKEAGAGLRSLAEPWADTTTPAGRMVLTVFAGIADFERSMIVERTSAGRIAAKARGVRFGPRPSLLGRSDRARAAARGEREQACLGSGSAVRGSSGHPLSGLECRRFVRSSLLVLVAPVGLLQACSVTVDI